MSEKNLLLLPKIKIHNANALSSPYTIGFPAMTAWLGFMHALQRKVNQQGFDGLSFKSVAVVSHEFDLQTFRGSNDFVSSIVGTGNPLTKEGSRPAFIEEARVHLVVSLLIEYEDDEEVVEFEEDIEQLVKTLSRLIMSMKIAGGDVLGFKKPSIEYVAENDEKSMRKCLRQLMPGYTLIERRELMAESMRNSSDALDAMLGFLTINHSSEINEDEGVRWYSQRKVSGWIVPIATGFQGISELGEAKNQRDPDTPHRFAECIITLGEFVMPHRIHQLDDMLWHYHTDTQNNLYLCQQNNRI